eukprot:gene31851-38512_t
MNMLATADAERVDNQIFVRNLSYKTTEEDLIKFFEPIGPIKNVSIAYNEKKESRGFGFVKFSLESDANEALTTLQGKMLNGRALKLDMGLKKERKSGKNKENKSNPADLSEESNIASEVLVEPEQAGEKKESKKRKLVEKVEKDDDGEEVKTDTKNTGGKDGDHISRSRQLVVFGVPIDVNKKDLLYALNKFSRHIKVELLKEDDEYSNILHIISPAGKVFLVTGDARKDTEKIQQALVKHTVRSLNLLQYVQKRKSSESEEVLDEALASLTCENRLSTHLQGRLLSEIEHDETLRKRKCRVIVRNLSFQASEVNVLDKMTHYGPLVQMDMPAHPSNEGNSSGKIKHRGFCFVTFLCRGDAEAVVKESAAVAGDAEGSKKGSVKICNRPVAIDFSLSKDTYQKYGDKGDAVEEEAAPAASAEEKGEQQNSGSDSDSDSDSDDDGDSKAEKASDASDEEADDSKDSGEEDEEDEDEDEENEDEDDQEEEEEDSKPASKKQTTESKQLYGDDVHEGCTLFLTNLPLDITEPELRQALSAHGQIVYCLLVKDKTTGLNRGSGFIKFSSKDQAESALAAAAAQNNTLPIKSREVRVMLALNKEGLDSLRGTTKKPMDKRNLYLANEGLDFSKDENLKMSPYDRLKRERAQSEKKKKLTSPLFCVSGIRLSIRNLKKSLTSQHLKLLAFRATKKGLSSNRVTTADISKYCEAQGLKPADCPINPPFSMKDVKAKVMLEGGEKGTKGKGFGFISFTQHAHALACLRELNNSLEYANDAEAEEADGIVEVNKGGSRLIVEFTLENMRK